MLPVSGRTMALRSTQPATEISTRDTPVGKASQYVGLSILLPSCADCLEIGELLVSVIKY